MRRAAANIIKHYYYPNVPTRGNWSLYYCILSYYDVLHCYIIIIHSRAMIAVLMVVLSEGGGGA